MILTHLVMFGFFSGAGEPIAPSTGAGIQYSHVNVSVSVSI